MAKNFRASLDTVAKFGSALYPLLALLLLTYTHMSNLSGSSSDDMPLLFILTAAYVFSYLYHPSSYTISEDALHVNRPLGKTSFSRSTMATAQKLNRNEIGFSFRVFGVGGLFGYYGRFYNSKLGHMTWYVSRRDTMVLITFSDGSKIVVSPDDPEDFITSLL